MALDLAGQTKALRAFSVVVSLAPYRLAPNGTRNRYERARLAKAARDEAALSCAVIPADKRPLWPRGVVLVTATITLPKGMRRLDDDNAKALFKPTLDGVQGYVVGNDRQIEWGAITWQRDERARHGIVALEFREVVP